jgi:hypothetical protein
MIELRGPESFACGLGFDLFENTRFMIILASLAASKGTFLSQKAWKTIPWHTHSRVKSHVQSLLDILADLPGLKEEFSRSEDYSDLGKKASRVYLRLLRWRQEWDMTPEGIITSISSEASVPLGFLPFGPALNFTSTMAANTVCNYDAALIQAVKLIKAAAANQQNRTPSCTAASWSRETDTHAEAAATEICQSVAFQMSGTTFMSGQFLLLFPLRMAWTVFGSTRPESQWIEQLLAGFERRGQFWSVQRQVIPRSY